MPREDEALLLDMLESARGDVPSLINELEPLVPPRTG